MTPDVTLCVMIPRDSEAAELAYQLRGGPVFEALHPAHGGSFGISPIVPAAGSDQIPFPTTARGVAFVDLTLVEKHPSAWAKLMDLGCAVVLDVHFPFGDDGHIRSIQPGRDDDDRDRLADYEAALYWSDPERLARCKAMIAEASVVTSPHEAWAELLDDLAEEVHLLFDVIDPISAGDFYFALTRAATVGGDRTWRRSVPRWKWIIARLLSPLLNSARHAGARIVEERVWAMSIDWDARRKGEH